MTTQEMAIATMIVPVDTKTFTEHHLEQSKNFINPEYYPELYKNLYGNLKFKDRRLVDVDSFKLDVPTITDAKTNTGGSSQTARLLGEGINKDQVWSSLDRGYILSKVPPSVVKVNGINYLCNGRTRHGKLVEQKKTNMIVDYYEAKTWDEFHFFSILSNRASEPESPHTLMDVKSYCDKAIKNGDLKREWSDITARVEAIVDGTFSLSKKKKIVTDIYHGDNLSENFIAYNDKTAPEFLIKCGYIDNVQNNGIYYYIMSSAFHGKALTSAAKYYDKLVSKGKVVKELRVMVHTSLLEGEEPIACWKRRVDRFRNKWNILKNQMRAAWFTTKSVEKSIITLFGATPACYELAHKFPMDKAVLFDKGILKEYDFEDLDEQFNPKED